MLFSVFGTKAHPFLSFFGPKKTLLYCEEEEDRINFYLRTKYTVNCISLWQKKARLSVRVL